MAPKCFKTAEEQRLDIQITFTNGSATYTTGDVVEGVAKITAISHMRFDKINIEFVGTARTYNDCNIAAAAGSQRPEAVHRFLKLIQPDARAFYPTDSILRAGKPCHIPFRFVVPEQLHPHVCSHSNQDSAASESHRLLPPSLGDDGATDLPIIPDDMAPRMTRIRYETTVQVTKTDTSPDAANRDVVGTKSRVVRIVPAVHAEPILNTLIQSKEYLTRQEKMIKKRISKAKCGALVVEAEQSQAILLRSVHADTEQSTMVTVALRFDPDNDTCTPPNLRNLISELQTTTHFTANVRTVLPTHDGRATDPYQGTYGQKIKLASKNTSSGDWVKRYSNSETSSGRTPFDHGFTPRPSAHFQGGAYYVAHLLIQVTLPSNKTFVPTFHSCLISRVYSLMLTLNMNTPGAQTSMNLKLPFQITADSMFNHYSESESDFCELGFNDEKSYSMDSPPSYLAISGLAKCLPSVSVVSC